ncbi:MAG: PilZ domain-containing protein [Planctomycetota bacterium]|jgi:hypothetical protein|nr:hypothetical protein [Planctomycetota bacterium]MDP6521060.1 PilZ domain-containing protein [Planctomycetota bacterium]MDP6837989.1 PilZ domain-containing protein [Planctomycetota bacterium]MDP6956852.1 PilZ domain-containing protein [Planctomycetota bacterium]
MGVGNVAADDRRGGDRRSIDGVLRLRVDSPHLDGKAENISDSGILFFTDRPLRVTVELEEDGVLRSRSGRLVRAQRIKGDTTGWAVEFDEQG